MIAGPVVQQEAHTLPLDYIGICMLPILSKYGYIWKQLLGNFNGLPE